MTKKEKAILLLKEAIRLLEEDESHTVFDDMDNTINDFFRKWITNDGKTVE